MHIVLPTARVCFFYIMSYWIETYPHLYYILLGTAKSVKAFRKLSAVLDDGEQEDSRPACNKDTGSKKQLQKWIRGHLFIVRGGGHIDMWQPLYQ